MNAQAPADAPAAPIGGPVSLTCLPESPRFNLRIELGQLDGASRAFGLSLPAKIGEGARDGSRRALCLGPDEWILSFCEADRYTIEDNFARLYPGTPHSLVEISDREVAVVIEGPQASTLLTVGCPIDIDRLAVGSGARTVFDGVQVVLYRDDTERFTMEVWRSFLPHIWGLLNTANRELAAGL